jgi:hypothetical protein
VVTQNVHVFDAIEQQCLGPAYDPGLLLVSTNQLFANDCPQPIVNNRWLATTASSRCGGYVVRI